MNPEHLRAFFWLRWRLLVHQFRKAGVVNFVFVAIILTGAVSLAAFLGIGGFVAGLIFLADAEAFTILLVWDAVVGAFLFLWLVGLTADLQRSEALAVNKFLHLPVSVSGVFILNYLSSLFSLTLVLFAPFMFGLTFGLVFSRGPAMLLLFPLVLSLLLMLTAVTYQFQGWLASLMTNKRRRRTVVVVVTTLFVLLAQLPNLINLWRPSIVKQDERLERRARERTQLDRDLKDGKISAREYEERLKKLHHNLVMKTAEERRGGGKEIAETVKLVNLCVPPGWLPLGAMHLAEGAVLPALGGTLGMALLAALSLRRAYRTTLRLYTGAFTAGKKTAGPAPSKPAAPAVKEPAWFLEKKLPGLSEQAAALTLATFRSLVRAPEAKMLLLTPILMLVIFGLAFFRLGPETPEPVRPLLAFAAMSLVLFTLVQLAGNQFGFDRSGFRVFVLSPVPRRDILLGKNLALAPLALVLCCLSASVIQVICPMRPDRFLAMVLQLISMYLLFCLLTNTASILAPMAIAPGAMRPTNTKAIPILMNMALVFLLPVLLAPTLLPLGIDLGLEALGLATGVPVQLILTVLEDVAVIFLYRLVLGWQGQWLQSREQKVLDVVAAKAE